MEDRLQYYKTDRDPKINAATTPPAGEKIRLPMIWAFEAYTPGLVGNLRVGANKLGWEPNESLLNPDFISRIEEWRSSSSGGGTLNLGHIVRPGSTNFFNRGREAPLPDGVTVIHAQIFQPLPSTTILCCQFMFDDDHAECLKEPLEARYDTYEEPADHGVIRIREVEGQKQSAVEVTRASLRSICAEWMREYFPGYFVKRYGALVPTCELLFFEKEEDFHKKNSRFDPGYLQMLDLNDQWDTWTSSDAPGLFLKLRNTDASIIESAILYGNVNSALSGKDITHYGNSREAQITNWLQYMERSFGTWILFLIAKNLVMEMGATRDTYGSLNLRDPADTEELIAMDQSLVDFQRNAIPFAHDLEAYCADEAYFMHDLYEFERVSEIGPSTTHLFANIRRGLISYAQYIKDAEAQLRFLSQQISSKVATISNDRLSQANFSLQRQIGWLTYLMALLTAVTAFEPLKALYFALRKFFG